MDKKLLEIFEKFKYYIRNEEYKKILNHFNENEYKLALEIFINNIVDDNIIFAFSVNLSLKEIINYYRLNINISKYNNFINNNLINNNFYNNISNFVKFIFKYSYSVNDLIYFLNTNEIIKGEFYTDGFIIIKDEDDIIISPEILSNCRVTMKTFLTTKDELLKVINDYYINEKL